MVVPERIRRCTWSIARSLNAFPHTKHSNGLSFVCVLMWVLKQRKIHGTNICNTKENSPRWLLVNSRIFPSWKKLTILPYQNYSLYVLLVHPSFTKQVSPGACISTSRTRGESEQYIARGRQGVPVRDSPCLWNPWQRSPKVQNWGISGSTKRTCVLQKWKKQVSPGALYYMYYCINGYL